MHDAATSPETAEASQASQAARLAEPSEPSEWSVPDYWSPPEAPPEPPQAPEAEAFEVRDEVTLEKSIGGCSFKLRGFHDGAALSAPSWLIDGVLPAQGVSMLFAPAGLGKTWVVDDWAVRIASGTPWLGRPVMRGGVLYIAAEGAFTLPLRTCAAKTNLGIDCQLPIWTVVEPIVFNAEGTHPEILAELVREEFARCRFPPVAFVVVDTYTECLQGSANDDDAATAFMRALRRFLRRLAPQGCPAPAALIVHHPGLAATERGRGSSAFTGAIDCGMLLEEVLPTGSPQPEAQGGALGTKTLVLHCAKPPRQGLPFPDIALQLQLISLGEEDLLGQALTALTVQPVPGEVCRRSARDEQQAQRAARDLRAINALKPNRILNSEEWRALAEVSSKGGWDRTRDALLASGQVVQLDPLPGKKRPRYALSPSRPPR